MKLKYYWHKSFNEFEPLCDSVDSDQSYGLLTSILSDDGGLGLDNMREWVDICRNNTKKILSGTLETYDWDCETFSAEISKDNTLIYFLYDESYFCTISTQKFYTVISSWSEFINVTPSENDTKIIEI